MRIEDDWLEINGRSARVIRSGAIPTVRPEVYEIVMRTVEMNHVSLSMHVS